MVGLTHIDDKKIENSSNTLIDIFVKTVKAVKSGELHIDIQNKPAIDIVATSDNESNKIDIDILEPELFDLFKISSSDAHKDKNIPDDKETDSSVDKILSK